ncbi:hypothetical protein ACLOJK_033204 [Asimina triloba]
MAAIPSVSSRVLATRQCRFFFPPFRLPFRLQTNSIASLSIYRLRFSPAFRLRSMAHSSTVVHVKDKVDLTEKEKKIFELLLDALRHSNLKTQLRVAGGWVRDKLLGKECTDIDIAVDDMLGREFCEKVNEYLLHAGEGAHTISVIQSNPDQSKHLETARMRIFDAWIDFVNLRSETYVDNSRIPAMKFGTAEEDAYRRDLTINSLFYNINNDSVEDLTGRGARFGFLLDEGLKKAAADEEVIVALAGKVSRERIGHEIDLMMSGSHPVQAMAYIRDLKLFSVVFSLPNNSEPPLVDGYDRFVVHGM